MKQKRIEGLFKASCREKLRWGSVGPRPINGHLSDGEPIVKPTQKVGFCFMKVGVVSEEK